MTPLPHESADALRAEVRVKQQESRVDALCNRIEARCAKLDARPTWVDDWVRRGLVPRKALIPVDVLLACAVPAPPSEDEFLAACRRLGFSVRGRRVGAWPTKQQQLRMRQHLHNIDRHWRLYQAITTLLLTAVEKP